MVRKGEFREDLYFRLDVVKIELPPLRDRVDDIPLLLGHFLDQFAEENNLPKINLTTKALSVLQAYRWPGNIRELRNFCENLVVLKQGGEVNEYDLDPRFLHTQEPDTEGEDELTPMYASPSGLRS